MTIGTLVERRPGEVGAHTEMVPTVTADQLELVKKTVAAGATDAELKLYLYDCARHGVHPLDKLLHFTKRAGKYTPITSIDLMRIRAADTGDCLGISDPWFGGTQKTPEFEARVTVKRLVQGQTAEFSATARWTEYCPAGGQDHMWQKMPHTMLGKCAEALALRKGFPKQLAGLYAREEMDQATAGTAAAPNVVVEPLPESKPPVSLPAGAVLLERVEQASTSKGTPYWVYTLSTGETVKDWEQRRASAAEQYVQNRTPVFVATKETKWGMDVTSLTLAKADSEPVIQLRQPFDANEPPPLTDADLAF